jgi:hypothetical protein
MLKKTEEIKNMFATIVVEKHTPAPLNTLPRK